MIGFSTHTTAVIMARSGGLCEAAIDGCTAEATERHHRANRGMGGTKRVDFNLPGSALHLCASCHRWITINPGTSYLNGWLVRHNGIRRPVEVKVLRRGAWVFLDDVGGLAPAESDAP